MRIGIDARFFNESGVGRYLRNLLSELKVLDKENEYYIFLLHKDFDQFNSTENFHKVKANFPWYGLTEQFKMPRLLNKYKLDLVHFPHFNIPIFYFGKFVVTIHDLIHQHFQMNRSTTHDPITYKIKQIGYKKVFKKAIKDSQKILVPSKYVKNQLINEWKIVGEKVIVTYEAVDKQIVSFGQRQGLSKKILEKFNIKPPFVFYVGNAHPHKNVEGLIEVFVQLRKRFQPLQLVLAGHDHYFWQRIKNKYQSEDIIYTGKINDRELVALYKNALLFVMPSFEEGFGIPILEAMACKCPVVSSAGGSLAEIGKGAVVYFNPHDKEDILEKIAMVLRSLKLRQELIKKGSQVVKEYSWKKMARETLEVYLQCV